MAKAKKSSKKSLLIVGDCLRLAGPLGFRGRLELSRRELCFVVTSKLDRMVGAKGWRTSVDDIVSVRIEGINRAVVVQTRKGPQRFIGAGAKRVYERLAASLAQRQGAPPSVVAFRQSERVLLQGPAELYVNKMLAVRGELMLSDYRLRFKSKRGLNDLVWREAQVDIALTQIRKLERRRVQQQLRIETSERVFLLGGKLTAAVYGWLVAQVYGRKRPDSARAQMLYSWPASLWRGPLMVHGQLMVSTRRLVFVLDGALDALVGTRDLLIELATVDALSVRGKIKRDRRLVVTMGEQERSFAVRPMDKRFAELVEVLSLAGARPPEQAGTLGVKLLSAFGHRVAEDDIGVVTGVLTGGTEMAVRRRWLVTTREQLFLLPPVRQGRIQAKATVSALNQVALVKDTEPSAHGFFPIRVGGVTKRIKLPAGAFSETEFWSNLQA